MIPTPTTSSSPPARTVLLRLTRGSHIGIFSLTKQTSYSVPTQPTPTKRLVFSYRDKKRARFFLFGKTGLIPGDDLLSRDLASNYHRRCSVSLPGSEWDRVVPPRCGHQRSNDFRKSNQTSEGHLPLSDNCVRFVLQPIDTLLVYLDSQNFSILRNRNQVYRMISTDELHMLPHLYPQPINVVVFHDPQGKFILGGAWRLDAFSAYLFRT